MKLFFCSFLLTVSLSAMTPDEAMQKLLEGNARYVHDKLVHPDRTSESRRALTYKQQPFAIILGCSDSRVAPEIVFDQGIGDLFIVRVAGNVAADVEIDSIEYAALYLGSVLVIVMGHENCGAVNAVMQGQTKDIQAVAELIEPAVNSCKKRPNPSLDQCIYANVRNVVGQVSKSTVLSSLVQQNKLKIVGAYYSLHTGKVEILPTNQ